MRTLNAAGIGLIIMTAGLVLFAGCRPGPHGCRKGMPDRILDRIDRHVADLKLTDAQQKRYDELRASAKSDFEAFRERHKRAWEEVNAELSKPQPDMAKIAAQAKKMHAERPDKFNEYADKLVAFYDTLDDGQKEQVIKKLRKANDRWGPR